MAAITTAAAGNWSATGTWTGGVVPGNGDTVTLNHAVTVDVDTTVGHSPNVESDTVQAVRGTTSGPLTIAAGVTLTLRGDYYLNGNLTMSAGSKIVMDSSQCSSPSTVAYNIKYSTNGGAAGACNIYINGTSANPCRIETLSGCKQASFAGTFYGLVKWLESYCIWTRVYYCLYKYLGADSNKETRVTGSVYEQMGGYVEALANDASCAAIPFTWDKIEFRNTPSGVTRNMYLNIREKSGATERKITNSRVPLEILWAIVGGVKGWDFTGSVFSRLNLPSGSPEGDCTGDEVIFLDSDGIPIVTLSNTNTVFTDLFLFGHNALANHQEGIHRPWGADINGIVWETGTLHTEYRVAVCGATDASVHPTNPGGVRPIKLKNIICRPNPGGDGPGFFMMMKGIKSHRIEIENMTFPMPGTNEYWHGAAKVSWGSNSRAYPDYITKYQNNLHWQPVADLSRSSYGINQLRTESNRTGTAGVGSTTTLINASVLLSGTVAGSSTGEGVYQIKMTSGPDAGLIRPVVSNTATTITVDPPFPNATAGYTFNAFPLDSMSDVDYNAFYKCPPTGTIYNANNDAARTNVVGYDGLVQTDYNAIGANDLVSSSDLSFVDQTRSIYTWATAASGLNHSLSTAWSDATAYVYGDAVSRAGGATYFSNQSLNWRCLIDHTSSSTTAPGGHTTNTWQKYWIPEGLFEIIQNKLGRTGFDSDATQSNYFAWMREGFAPTNTELLTAGYDGGYIGAVQPYNPDSTAPILSSSSVTVTGTTTATASISTDDGNGTLYFLASGNATETSSAIKAALSQSVTAVGAQSISLSALDANTQYYLHVVHRNAASLDSSVATVGPWRTQDVPIPLDFPDTAPATLLTVQVWSKVPKKADVEALYS